MRKFVVIPGTGIDPHGTAHSQVLTNPRVCRQSLQRQCSICNQLDAPNSAKNEIINSTAVSISAVLVQTLGTSCF